jgi:hypothetical protein
MSRQPPRGRRQKPSPTSYAGLTTCLRCDQVFESWDRRQNRLCDACRQAIAEQPSEEPSYRLTKHKGRSQEVDGGRTRRLMTAPLPERL